MGKLIWHFPSKPRTGHICLIVPIVAKYLFFSINFWPVLVPVLGGDVQYWPQVPQVHWAYMAFIRSMIPSAEGPVFVSLSAFNCICSCICVCICVKSPVFVYVYSLQYLYVCIVSSIWISFHQIYLSDQQKVRHRVSWPPNLISTWSTRTFNE